MELWSDVGLDGWGHNPVLCKTQWHTSLLLLLILPRCDYTYACCELIDVSWSLMMRRFKHIL